MLDLAWHTVSSFVANDKVTCTGHRACRENRKAPLC
jgi:hypothetical protein